MAICISIDRFRETYGHERRATDLHVFTRAQLLSEIALVRWLVHGLHAEDSSIVEEARAMLDDLANDLDGEPLLPSHASAMGARISLTPIASPSASPIEASEPTPSTADDADDERVLVAACGYSGSSYSQEVPSQASDSEHRIFQNMFRQ